MSHPYDHIKFASNLSNMVQKRAEEEEKKKRKKKDDKERRVDYSGRAGRGALWGGGLGALGGGALGGLAGLGYQLPPVRAARLSGEGVPSVSPIPALAGLGIGALIGGGLGAGSGALSGLIDGYRNEDLITRQSEPYRLRRGLVGAGVGSLGGLPYGPLGIAGGAVGGGLYGGLIEPWFKKDLYSQDYLRDDG